MMDRQLLLVMVIMSKLSLTASVRKEPQPKPEVDKSPHRVITRPLFTIQI